jgi:hypothetical protein
VIAFTLYPDNLGSDRLNELKMLFPRDFKRTTNVSEEARNWFRQADRFHICIIVDKHGSIFHSNGNDRREVARDSLVNTLAYVKEHGAPEWIVRSYKRLVQISRRGSFNVVLYDDVLLLALCYSFVVGLLAREARIGQVCWCSDRDSRTNWAERVLFDVATLNAYQWATWFGAKLDPKQLPHLILTNDDSAKLFDHIIRPPDFLAGALSAWDVRRGSTNEGADKYGHILRDALAENDNVALLHMSLGEAQMVVNPITIRRAEIAK